MSEVLPVAAALALSGLPLLWVRTRYSSPELMLIATSLVAHIFSTFFLLYLILYVYGIGDVLMYDAYAGQIARLLHQDFLATSWQLVLIFAHQESVLADALLLPATSTSTLIAIVSVLYFFFAKSMVAASIVLAVASWGGKIALFEGTATFFEPHLRRRLLVSCLLVPSVVLWSGGIVKEGVAMVGLGLFMLGLGRIQHRRDPLTVATIGVGLILIAFLKAHILLGLVFGLAAWTYWRRSTNERGEVLIRPVYLVLGIAVLGFGTVLVGELFPQFALDQLSDQAAQMQVYGSRGGGGSKYTIGDPLDRSMAGQLAFVPFALFTALYRPLPFEANNPQMMLNALETTAFLGLTIYTLGKRGLTGMWQQLARSPFLLFLLVFTIIFGSGVGLVSNTLGTLSRYRIPMVPFFAAFVLIMSAAPARAARRVAAGEPWVRPIDRERREATGAQTP